MGSLVTNIMKSSIEKLPRIEHFVKFPVLEIRVCTYAWTCQCMYKKLLCSVYKSLVFTTENQLIVS
jgi:hypothetical protein